MRTLLCLGLLLSAGSAWASGGIGCTSEGGTTQIEVNAGVTHGMGGPIFSLQGTAEVSDAKVAEDLRKSTFEKAHAAQYWLDGEELRLLLYREREGEGEFGSVELQIKTTNTGEESTYAGDYTLTIADMTGVTDGLGKTSIFKGKVTCFAE